MGKPVVATRLPLVEQTFGAESVVTYPSGDARGDGRGDHPSRR